MPAPTLTSTVNVLSTMITPAVLIMACGSLILTTSTRLIRAVDRVREMEPEIEKLTAAGDQRAAGKREMIMVQLDRALTRARMLQRALALLYGALAFFVGTSVALGLSALSNLAAWIPLVLGLIGAGLLFSASVMLIFESRIALAATYAETDYIRSISR
ncbi:MAG TPA: DUF2721 domain-containing protein [Thermoanaerobaculia bacterium]|nr:DUF2721 domain-containing protein [Thermoanaerobaculia bacterium]